jgi:hypothetical protein
MSLVDNATDDYVIALQDALDAKIEQLRTLQGIIENLETVIHKAARIAGHLPFLCAEMPEVSNELEQAALQLQQILVQRDVS